jgi:predicted phage terminase large subunit-like protein
MLKPERSSSEKWSARFFETTTGVAAAARGSGGQVRGLLHNGRRPDLVIVDDLEDRDEVRTDTLREKTRTWFMQDLKPVLPKIGGRGRMTVLGTILHEDCLLERLAVDPEWSCVKMGALDRSGSPLWDQYLTRERLEAEKQSFARQGNLRGFYMEYMSKTIAPETQIFKQEMFRYGRPPGELVAIAVAMDPAISEKRTADETVIAVVGMTDRGYHRVLDMWGARTQDDKLKLDMFFQMIQKWHALDLYAGRFGIESVAYQATLIHTCREMMARKGMYFEVQPITHKTKKTQRIKGVLQPRLAAGYLYFGQHFPELETQLLEFREDDSHLHDDRPDAVSMAITLLDDFAPQAAASDPTKDEYPPLEDAIGGTPEWVH